MDMQKSWALEMLTWPLFGCLNVSFSQRFKPNQDFPVEDQSLEHQGLSNLAPKIVRTGQSRSDQIATNYWDLSSDQNPQSEHSILMIGWLIGIQKIGLIGILILAYYDPYINR